MDADKKKQIILCSPTDDDMRGPLQEGKENKFYGRFFPPLGLLFVAQALKNAEYNVKFFDGNLAGQYIDELLKTVQDHHQEIVYVGFYLSFLQIKDFFEIVIAIKEIGSQIKIVVGGPFPAVFARKIMESELVDVCCTGDGAEIAVRIAKALNDEDNFADIPNIGFRRNEDVVFNAKTFRDELNKDNFIWYENFLDVEEYVGNFDLYLG